jgi:hypothetical protein
MIKNIVLCVSYERGFAYADTMKWISSGKERNALVFVVNGIADADRLCEISTKMSISKDVKIIAMKGVQKGYEKEINDYFRSL